MKSRCPWPTTAQEATASPCLWIHLGLLCPVEGVGGGLFCGFALAIRKIVDATNEKPVAFLASGTAWGITALNFFKAVSPTGNVVSAYHQFGTLTTAHMVGVLKAHFKRSRVKWSVISTHLAPLQGRPRWFFGYFMPLFLTSCKIGDCNTPATWSNAIKAGVKATFEAGANNMANQMGHGLAARGTSVPVDTRGEAMLETVRSTEPLPRVIQACIYSQMACNGKLQANSTAVRVLVNAAILRAYGDDCVCFNDEPILAEALRRVGVESMNSPVDEDAGFAHIEGVQVNKGTKLELYTQWAILRRCVKANSTPRTAHCTLRQALGSLRDGPP